MLQAGKCSMSAAQHVYPKTSVSIGHLTHGRIEMGAAPQLGYATGPTQLMRLQRAVSMKGLLFASLLLLCCLSGTVAFDWNLCSNSSQNADIKDVSLTPENPAAGVTVSFAIHGIGKIEVPSGALDISVMYSGLPIYSESRDLCDMAKCPIEKGPFDISYDQYLPPIVPPGPYNVTLEAKSTSGEELLCLEVLFDVQPPSMKAAVSSLLRGATHKAQA